MHVRFIDTLELSLDAGESMNGGLCGGLIALYPTSGTDGHQLPTTLKGQAHKENR